MLEFGNRSFGAGSCVSDIGVRYSEFMSTDRSLFDVLGPIMIGPSSSHTAGAVRLGLLATAVFGRVPKSARIQLHGSFALTGKGHGTDLALVAGLLGMRPDDPRIATALDAAKSAGLEVGFSSADLGDVHPNTVRFELVDEAETLSLQGSSVGGGEVLMTRIGHFDAHVDGRMPLLLVEHVDSPGEIAAVTGEISQDGANIAEMRVSRKHRGEAALMLIVTDTQVGDRAVAAIERRELVTRVRRVPPI